MIDLHLSAFAPRWRFLYAVRIDAYAETAHLHIWLRLITRERDYNLYTYFFAK